MVILDGDSGGGDGKGNNEDPEIGGDEIGDWKTGFSDSVQSSKGETVGDAVFEGNSGLVLDDEPGDGKGNEKEVGSNDAVEAETEVLDETVEFDEGGDTEIEKNEGDSVISGAVVVEENVGQRAEGKASALQATDDVSVKGKVESEQDKLKFVLQNGDHKLVPNSDNVDESSEDPVDTVADDGIDGHVITDSEDDGDTDDEGDGKELFDSSALAVLLKAAAGADTNGDTITITSQDDSKLFSFERPAGLGSSLGPLRPTGRLNRPGLFSTSSPYGAASEMNLSEEEKRKLEKLQQIRVKFLRLVHRLGLSPDEPMTTQILYRLGLLGGRQNSQFFSFDAAKKLALELEAGEKNDLDFSVNILVLGKNGVGKSATINSLFGEEKVPTSTFDVGTTRVKEACGFIDGVEVRVVDTPGLKTSTMEQGFNQRVLSSVKSFTQKNPTDVVLYVDRLNAHSRDLDNLPLMKTVTNSLGSSIWKNGIVTLTHAASAPPDGPSGAPLSYDVFVSQRSHVIQKTIGHASGDLRMMSPSLMNPVSLVENHPSCRRNREGQKILPNGQSWRPQLLLLCYSVKILSEANSIAMPQYPFDHRRLLGYPVRTLSLPYTLLSMLQSRPHPKLRSDQGLEIADIDVDFDDDLLDDEEDEYDQLPPFQPLGKDELEMLSKEQKKAYFEEYDYRVKLLHKKLWKEELRRIKEMRKKRKDASTDYYVFLDDDTDSNRTPTVSVPLPDLTLPPTFDGDDPTYRYRFLEPTSQFRAQAITYMNGWDHDCGYDGIFIEHNLAIANTFPASYTIQLTKDKTDFTINLDSAIAAKLGQTSVMANFEVKAVEEKLAYFLRAESKFKRIKKHKAGAGITIACLGEDIVTGLRIEDHISFGKQYALIASAGAVKSRNETAYGANIELQRREIDYPIGQLQSSLNMSITKWRGDLILMFNTVVKFMIGRNSKITVGMGINNKKNGQITVRTSSSDHLSLGLSAVIQMGLFIYKKLWSSD